MDVKEKLAEFIEQGNLVKSEIVVKHQIQGNNLLGFAIVSADLYEQWKNDIKLYLCRNLLNHPFHDDLINLVNSTSNIYNNYQDLLSIVAKLQSIISDDEYWNSYEVQSPQENINTIAMDHLSNNKIFIVHGHDNGTKGEVARFIEKLKLEAIILHEQPDSGQTIIEKLTKHADVGYAIILYTPCDEGKSEKESEYKKRARQNVIFEHGYFVAKLGRDRVCALVKDDVEIPSDLSGVLFKQMNSEWKYEVVDELKVAGYAVSKDML